MTKTPYLCPVCDTLTPHTITHATNEIDSIATCTACGSTQPGFSNPYTGCEGGQKKEAFRPCRGVRIQTFAWEDDYLFLQSIRTRKGTVATVVNLLFVKLVEEARRRGITDLTDRKRLEEFVTHAVIVRPEEVNILAYNGIETKMAEAMPPSPASETKAKTKKSKKG